MYGDNFVAEATCLSKEINCKGMTVNLSDLTHADIAEMIFERLLQHSIHPKRDICHTFAQTVNFTCDRTALKRALTGYAFPPLLFLCLLGNAINLIVYTAPELRRNTTVRMLMAKAVVNMLFMLCLLPNALVTMNGGDRYGFVDEAILWSAWPYLLSMVMTAGFCAAWFTVLMTLERYLFIAYPVTSKQWSTHKNVCLAIAFIVFCSILINIEIALAREVGTKYCANLGFQIHFEYVKNGRFFETWDKLYQWNQVIFQAVMPNAFLLFFSIRIAYHLTKNSLPTHFSERKQCVTRITMATTACHLVLEIPNVILYFIAALYAPAQMNYNLTLCSCTLIFNLASQLNASICFLIYATCSSKFRSLVRHRFRHLFLRIICGQPIESVALRSSSTMRHRRDTQTRFGGAISSVNAPEADAFTRSPKTTTTADRDQKRLSYNFKTVVCFDNSSPGGKVTLLPENGVNNS